MGKNALIVKLVMDNEVLKKANSILQSAHENLEREIWRIQDEQKESEAIRVQQQSTINRMDDEFWAERAEVQRLRDQTYATKTAAEELAVLNEVLKKAKDIVDGWQDAGKFTKPTNGGA